VRSRECALLSREYALLSRECALLSRECALLSRECALLSREYALLSRECALLSREELATWDCQTLRILAQGHHHKRGSLGCCGPSQNKKFVP
jgi:hypothetical protein